MNIFKKKKIVNIPEKEEEGKICPRCLSYFGSSMKYVLSNIPNMPEGLCVECRVEIYKKITDKIKGNYDKDKEY